MYSRPLGGWLGIPVVHTFHGVHVEEYSRVARASYRMLEAFMSLWTSAVISVSREEREVLLDSRMVSESKCHLIENGVRVPDVVEPYAARSGLTVVTRYNYQKNAEAIIPIVEDLRGLLPGVRVVVMGDGPGRQSFAKSVEARGLADVIFPIGDVDDVRQHLRTSLCYLSTARWEGLPLALLEAMSEGTPAVVSDVVGHRDVVDPSCGYLVDTARPERVASAIAGVLTDRGMWEQRSEASWETVRRTYSEVRMGQQTLDLYVAMCACAEVGEGAAGGRMRRIWRSISDLLPGRRN